MKKFLSLMILLASCMTTWALNGGTSSATAVALAQGDNEIPFVNPAWADYGYAAVAWYYVDVESEGELTLSFSNTGNYNFRYTEVYLYGSDASTAVWSKTETSADDFSTTQAVSAGRYYVKFDYAAGVNLNVSLTGGSVAPAIGSHDNPYVLEENVSTELKMVYEGGGWESYGYSNTAVWYAFTATKAGNAVLTLNGNGQMIDYAVYKGETLVESTSNVYEGVSTVEVAEGDVVYLMSTYARGGATVVPSIVVPVEPQTTDVTVTAAGYATWVAPFDIDVIPAGVEACAAKYNGSTVQLTPLTVLPEGTPVVLKGAGTFTFTEATREMTDDDYPEDNALQIAYESFQVSGDEYVLAQKNGVVGFYKATAGTTLAAGKCYMYIYNEAKSFVGFDEADGINAVNASENSEIIYNINGQRLSTMQKGINIVGGKAILVK